MTTRTTGSTREQVLDVVRNATARVIPDADTSTMTLDGTLTDLGANSIDRAEIATMAMMELGVKVPAKEFAGVKDIGSLVDVLRSQLS